MLLIGTTFVSPLPSALSSSSSFPPPSLPQRTLTPTHNHTYSQAQQATRLQNKEALQEEASRLLVGMATAPGSFQVQVNDPLAQGKTATLEISAQDSTPVLKLRLQQKFGIPAGQMWLSFNGRRLEDNHTAQSSGIETDSRIQLLMPLRGGSVEDAGMPTDSAPSAFSVRNILFTFNVPARSGFRCDPSVQPRLPQMSHVVDLFNSIIQSDPSQCWWRDKLQANVMCAVFCGLIQEARDAVAAPAAPTASASSGDQLPPCLADILKRNWVAIQHIADQDVIKIIEREIRGGNQLIPIIGGHRVEVQICGFCTGFSPSNTHIVILRLIMRL
jgi:hypothetical protein